MSLINQCSPYSNTTAGLSHPSLLYPSLNAHRHTQRKLGIGTGKRECMKQFRMFGNRELEATVYDHFTLKSFDSSFHSPGAFSAMGTENCLVILV